MQKLLLVCYYTSNWLWIEICENEVLSKIDIIMTTIKKQNAIDKSRILRINLDSLLKILKFGYYNIREK